MSLADKEMSWQLCSESGPEANCNPTNLDNHAPKKKHTRQSPTKNQVAVQDRVSMYEPLNVAPQVRVAWQGEIVAMKGLAADSPAAVHAVTRTQKKLWNMASRPVLAGCRSVGEEERRRRGRVVYRRYLVVALAVIDDETVIMVYRMCISRASP